MNKAFALAVLISASAVGGAYAQDMGLSATAPHGVNVVLTNPELDNTAKRLDIPDTYIHPTQAMINQAQNEVKSDSALRRDLIAQNVELNNVVGIDTAADGSRTVYVR